MGRHKIEADDVLGELDSAGAAEYLWFTSFGNSNMEFIGARLAVYSDGCRWAIVIGHAYFGSAASPETPVKLFVDSYGNAVKSSQKRGGEVSRSSNGLTHSYSLPITNAREAFVKFPLFLIRSDVKNLEIRGESVPLKFSRAIERESGLLDSPAPFEMEAFPELSQGARWSHKVFRALFLQRPDLILPTDEEMRSRLPEDLPCLLNLSEWCHPNFEESPSETECFQQLAEVCATCDPVQFDPTEPANTHWSHWGLPY